MTDTLTEDDFTIYQNFEPYSTLDTDQDIPFWYLVIGNNNPQRLGYMTKEKAEQLKQQILQALQENPKLKAEIEEKKKSLDEWISNHQQIENENQLLKEQISDQASQMVKAGMTIKLQNKELESLKELKQRIEEFAKQFDFETKINLYGDDFPYRKFNQKLQQLIGENK